MNLLGLSIIAAAGIKAIVFFIYLFLYLQYRERFLGYWTLAWGLIFVKSAMDPHVFSIGKFHPTFFVLQVVSILSILFLAWGTWDFVGRRLPKLWIYAAFVLIPISGIGVLLNWSLLSLIIPHVIMFGLIHIHTGFVLLRNLETQGLGKKITAYAFIINGLHQFDFPLFRPTDMAPWGYLLDAFLRLIIGIGFLLAYFEKTRENLTKQEAQFRLLAENAKDVIFRYQLLPSAGLEYISPSVADITGYKPEEYYADAKLILKIIHPEDRRLLQGFNQSVSSEMPIVLRLITKGKSQIWAEQHIVPIHDPSGKLIAFEGIIRDITARKQLEQELFRLDRLNLVGQMAANIGHEIRNPLTTVRGYLQVLSRKKELESYHENFSLLLDELDRANSLITEYLSLSKNRLTDRRLHNLNAIVESLYPLIEATATGTNHIVKLELTDVPDLLLDEKEIRQLILNLTHNGMEAMAPGKTLTIRTYCQSDTVVLAVQDQGQEIPAEVLEKLGIPFFTTKETGTGLGLAICYSIANRHGAKIHIKTDCGGTTFFVQFNLNYQ
jgi:PAS domain S-box-containing protein